MDSNTGFLETGTEARSVRHSSGCSVIPRVMKTTDTQIPGVSGPSTTPGTPRGKNNKVALVRQPGHGYCPAHTSTDRDSFIGESTGGSAK